MDRPPQSYSDYREFARTIGSGRLSLGMSGDIELAVSAGTSVLRVGSAILGER